MFRLRPAFPSGTPSALTPTACKRAVLNWSWVTTGTGSKLGGPLMVSSSPHAPIPQTKAIATIAERHRRVRGPIGKLQSFVVVRKQERALIRHQRTSQFSLGQASHTETEELF